MSYEMQVRTMLCASNGFGKRRVKVVVLDVETLDYSGSRLWNEPIISYCLGFLNTTNLDAGSFRIEGCICENLEEEEDLLARLVRSLADHRGVLLAGHNISHSFRYIEAWSHGYDIPKITRRSGLYGLDVSFLESVRVFDLMDVAFEFYDHTTHNLTWNGEKQRILKSQFLEEQLRVIRPVGFEKMGHEIRRIYQNYAETGDQSLLRRILLYNCCDVTVESILFKIFHHLLNRCKRQRVSFGTRCQHIPDKTIIEELPAWRKLGIHSSG